MSANPGNRDTATLPAGPARLVSEPARVLLCAAHTHVLWGLRKLVDGEWPRMLVVGAVPMLRDAESYLRLHPAEAALLDLPEATGATLAEVERLCRSFPTSFVMLGGADALDSLAGAGVKAVLPLDAPAERILKAIYQAVGEAYEH